MNKSELINNMAKESGLMKKDTELALNSLLKVVENALVNGENVQLIGFGTFEVKDRKARQGRNPRNPEEIINIPASKAPIFRAGKGLKEAVNK